MVVISTSQNAINYGAVLQSYAFAEYLKELNIDYNMLNYYEKYNLYFSSIKFLGFKYVLSCIYINFLNFIHVRSKYQQLKRFHEFITKNIHLTKEYRTVQELKSNPPSADIYITGGDQMFNCHAGVGVQGFLNFGNKNTKRYSYSTSMGIKEPPKQYLDDFIKCINQYEIVSLREESAKKYIDDHCNVKTQVNLDPVFLLDKVQWYKVIKNQPRIHKKPYILVYELLYHPLTTVLTKEVNKNNDLDIVVLSASARNRIKGNKVIRNAGPVEFINLFANAEKVITTSFHGTCFSIIFEKEFYSLINDEREVRINSLLHKFNLSKRMLTSKSVIPAKMEMVDFSISKKIIASELEKSRKYLLSICGENNE